MSDLPPQSQSEGGVETATASKDAPSAPPATESSEPAATSSNQEAAPATEAAVSSTAPQTEAPAENVEDTEAIGPSTSAVSKSDAPSTGPAVHITLLLTNGARHPYKIDQRYLRKRSVDVENMDPFNISVYTLKELIWRDWRSEWEPRPSNPSYIRLIHFGRMLEDKLPLKECRFNHDAPNIVHMTVKPQEIVDEEDTKTGKGGRDRDGEDRDAGCRCVIL
ncbi:hypothetical protein NA57DRAFT_45595 [Rhizodiscina lignyota]|uniref:UBL3-like ubiquitin domain-containing protein n=1 Tax=Rhizodiscina lignyota TaxID=1504668 RepID=A0A9P4I4F6_9PEZI|nr:hypothetical protein NA57DRAFT_45595 [Rhizodiscina lignyota]